MMAGLTAASALFFYLSFPNMVWVQGASFLVWGCALPFFLAIEGRPWPVRVVLGLAWGVLAHGLLVAWLMPVSLGGWLMLTLALALQGGIFAVFFAPGMKAGWRGLVLIPCAWVFSEWLRYVLLGGFSWNLGYAQAGHPELIQLASLGGGYALSWCIICVNMILYGALSDLRHRLCWVFAAAAVVALLWVAGALRLAFIPESPGVMRVAAVQANIARDDKVKDAFYDANMARHLALTKKAAMAGRLGEEDLVVWPETAVVDDIITDLKWRPRLEEAARNLRINMLIGSALVWDGHDLNSAVLLSAEGVWRGVYHKMRLVPFSERIPPGLDGLARALGIAGRHFTAGTRQGVMAVGKHKFGVVICSEELYPDMFRHLSQSRVDVVAVMLNDGWFERPEALLLHGLAAPVRAVESGLALVRSANTGKTCAFDGYGRPLGRGVDLFRPGIGVYDVPPPVQTFYARWGDVFALLCGVFVIMNVISGVVRPMRSGYAV